MLQDRIVQKNLELLPQLMYLNTDFPPISKDEIEIKEQLSDNAILLLDGTTSSEQAMRRMSVMLGGIGFSTILSCNIFP
jgi:hypothetical protein